MTNKERLQNLINELQEKVYDNWEIVSIGINRGVGEDNKPFLFVEVEMQQQ